VDSHDALVEIAAAIADGRPIDWPAVTKAASGADELELIRQLEFIAALTGPMPASSSASAGTPPTTAGAAPAGTPRVTWGPLTIIERIGQGSFGEVYRARDPHLERDVALKLLRRQTPGEADADSGVDEGRLLARIRHPNVVTVYGAERLKGEVGLWMEYIEGRTLEQELRAEGPFTVDSTVAVGIAVTDAMAAVQRAGIFHCDLKAHNVMRDRDGRVVVTDFGAGRDADRSDSPDRAGTPVCTAPEVLAGSTPTAHSEIYSVGVLMYHLVTGTYPVLGRSVDDVRDAHVSGARTPLAVRCPELPEAFVAIVERALAPEPSARYATPEDLRTALESLRDERAGRNAAPALRRRWLGWTASLAAAIALASALAWREYTPVATPAIAILPFKDLAKGPDSQYVVTGLTDEIIRNLSIVAGLQVRSRASSSKFSESANLAEVGRQLGVNLVLEGSVMHEGNRLRVETQLVRVADATTIWSGRFDRELKDLFAIQDEISRSIANTLRLTLSGGERHNTTDVHAYDAYLRARALLYYHDMENARRAVELFGAVTAEDPAFAPAHAGLADAWAIMSANYQGVLARDALPRIRDAAQRALDLDPLLAEGHAAMAMAEAREYRWAASEVEYRRAIDLNPNLSAVRENFAVWTLFAEGKIAEALEQLEAARSTDPLSTDIPGESAYILVSAGRYHEAIEQCRNLLSRDRGDTHVEQVMARAMFQQGQRAEAIEIFRRQGTGSAGFLGYALAHAGQREEASRLAETNRDFPVRESLIQAGLGNVDAAIAALQRMAERKEPRVQILTYPELSGVRADPRFRAVRRAFALPSGLE
jgi:eukaryotic-like serine/threonine-protein kinase